MALLFAGCAGSPYDDLAAARQALADAAYADAIDAADAGLGRNPDERTAWGLEMVKLEARARSGLGEAVVAQLEQLAIAYPERVPSTQYSATAFQLRSGGDGAAAIQVLDMGLKRFPGSWVIERMIAMAQTSDEVDSGELEMLRSLGYIE